MTLPEVAFLIGLGVAFSAFITVLAWVAHITRDLPKQGKDAGGAQANTSVSGTIGRNPRLDHAA